MELLDSFFKQWFLFSAEERSADTYSLLVRSHRVEWEYSDTVVHQLACELQVVHTRVLHSEVESVCQRRSEVIIVNEIEAVRKQHVFHELGSAPVFTYIVKEIIRSVTCRFHQCSHSMLHTMGGAARQGVHKSVADEITKLIHSERTEGWVDAAIEYIADTQHTDTLTCIRESFRTRNSKDVIVSIACNSSLEGRFKWMREVATEVHGEISQVLKDNDIMFGCQHSDTFQLFFVETYPRWVIRVGIYNATDIACREDLIEFCDKCLSTEIVDI